MAINNPNNTVHETLKEFGKVCVSASDVDERLVNTLNALNFLQSHKGERYSPKELAIAMGRTYTYRDGNIAVFYEGLVNPLHWLWKLGYIHRESYTYEIQIPNYRGYREDVKYIDGVKYVAKTKDNSPFSTKTITAYRWYAE